MKRNILIIGSGAREHAIGRKLRRNEPRVAKLYFAPGNAGTVQVGMNVPIAATDISKLVDFSRKNDINLAIVGPDDPLALGIVGAFNDAGIPVFGPTKAAARIESSKEFGKGVMEVMAVPTAPYRSFTDHTQALSYARLNMPCFIKASGLALGKGAYPCHTIEDVMGALNKIMIERVHGAAGDVVVIEKLLEGVELSVHAICSGRNHILFPLSMDHKTLTADPKSPMTGGMGAVAPIPWVDQGLMDTVGQRVVGPILAGLAYEGAPFTGCLYPNVMLTKDGPQVLECNARFGDPEAQVLMTLLESPLLDIISGCIDGTLKNVEVKWRKGYAACVVLASREYPGVCKKGIPIHMDAHPILGHPDVSVYHAATEWKDGIGLVTAGGRVFSVTAYHEDSLEGALDLAYVAVKSIHFDGMCYRSDIGERALHPPEWFVPATD